MQACDEEEESMNAKLAELSSQKVKLGAAEKQLERLLAKQSSLALSVKSLRAVAAKERVVFQKLHEETRDGTCTTGDKKDTLDEGITVDIPEDAERTRLQDNISLWCAITPAKA